jgi:hypothetical protein
MMNENPCPLCAGRDRRSDAPSLMLKMKVLDVLKNGKNANMVSHKTRFGQFRRYYVIPRNPNTPLQASQRRA